MSFHQDDEKEEKGEKEEEKHEKGEWQRDRLSTLVWAAILIWAGLVFLAANAGYAMMAEEAWPIIAAGAGVIILLEAVVRTTNPTYRRPVGGTIILGVVLLAIGLGVWFDVSLLWPLVLVAIGVGMLLRGLARPKE